MDPLAPHIEKRILESFARQKLMTAYGATVTGVAHGYMAITVPPKDFLLRTSGIFHGGVIAAIADTAAGYAAGTLHTADASFLTIEFKINFLNQAKGEQLIAKARILKGGKTLTIAQTDVFTEDDHIEKHVATAIVTLMKANT
ncbi:uncharacterized protein (TIGR00369 family) [Chitinophaga niastensis]|uniref:Medium/long-chain acyl-CoA thioesterase YigI n=1 Tax=Chitinophaga niastensis TaxID=536980 RepID=A0A2P8HGI0_CHINA|nr:PaaI family thioesterase [Chitinophaga niastensis]PSL45306.1 uncharacterized protein (TIGR00369 family) [Chitinophaga niastensis]